MPLTLGPDDLNPISLPADVYPIERGICGSWVQAYVRLHSDIIAGKLPPRYAIMMSDSSGLGDRLTSSVTIALYAILTKRAFLYDWRGNHDLWNAFRSTYIDWRYKGQDKAMGSSQVLHMLMYDKTWWPGGCSQGCQQGVCCVCVSVSWRHLQHGLCYSWGNAGWAGRGTQCSAAQLLLLCCPLLPAATLRACSLNGRSQSQTHPFALLAAAHMAAGAWWHRCKQRAAQPADCCSHCCCSQGCRCMVAQVQTAGSTTS